MVRRAALVLLLLLCGLAVSLAAALSLAAWANIDTWWEERPAAAEGFDLPDYLQSDWPPPVSVLHQRGHVRGISALTVLCMDEKDLMTYGTTIDPLGSNPIRRYLYRHSFGWPARCMSYDYFGVHGVTGGAAMAVLNGADRRSGWTNWSIFPAWVPTARTNMGPQRPMPRSIHWPGLGLNTLFFAAVLGVLVAVPRRLRSVRRRLRGLCGRCAYPISAAVCPECGTPTPAREPVV